MAKGKSGSSGQGALERDLLMMDGLFELFPGAVLAVDSYLNIVRANAGLEAMYGYRQGELAGRPLSILIPPRFLKGNLAAAKDFFRSPKAGALEPAVGLWGLRTDGTEFPVEVVVRPVEIQGRILALSVLRDMSEQRRAEESLRKLSQEKAAREKIKNEEAQAENLRLSQVLAQSPVAVMITDTKGKIEYVNPKFTQSTGYSLEQVRGRNPRLLKSGETSPDEYRRLWETITSGREWRGELHNKRKDGTMFWERATIAPLRDAEGRITHFVALKEDISDWKGLQSQFIQAQKMEGVGRLAGGVAHDFNNLLTAISGLAELSAEKFQPGNPIRADLEELMAVVRRAAGLTRQLLAFSRRQVLEPRDLDPNALIVNVERMLKRVIGEDVKLETRLSPLPGCVRADPGQLEQVIVNLAVNARDAMPNGGRLILETSAVLIGNGGLNPGLEVPAGEYLRLAMADTGTGMTPEVRARLFEPFFTTKEQGKGTGLGLATCYGIIKQSGGFIYADSEPGRGTTFTIYLPLLRGRVPEVGRLEKVLATTAGTETVLLVEDDAAVRRLAGRVLTGRGYTVLEAAGASEALEWVAKDERQEIRLLVTDVIMPGTNGRELADRVSVRRPDIKVLFISGYTDEALGRHGVMDAGIAFLRKPFTPQDLAVKVREVLG